MISVQEFHRPKLGNRDEEYEDSFAYNLTKQRFAIADGASDSIFSNVWARSLVNAFVDGSLTFAMDSSFLKNIIYMARRSWYNNIPWKSLKVFVKNKAIKGSFSTFLGLQLDCRGKSCKYRVIAVGDSCMFTMKGDSITGFPLNDPAKFNITPNLIWSGYGSPFPEEYDTKLPRIEFAEGTLREGESIMLATDAISKWILDNAPDSFPDLLANRNPMGFITGLLESREIRNDDITFSSITLRP